MRLSEIAAREDLWGVLIQTLQDGWRDQAGSSVTLNRTAVANSQAWSAQPLLSCVVVRPCSAEVRRFAADGFRYTPSRARTIGQWLIGTLLATNLGLRISAKPVFWVSPPLPSAENLLILPGNRRIRVFDFSTGRCRVFLKVGCDSQPMRAEVRVRGGGRRGPFVPIVAWDSGWRWFDEEIVAGHSLPRCPPWWPRRRLERDAVGLMDSWLSASASDMAVVERVSNLNATMTKVIAGLGGRVGWAQAAQINEAMAVLARAACRISVTQLADSHGDFQPGNVMVENGTHRVLLADWEYSARRFRWYDPLVWGLRSRAPEGLEGRLRRFIADGTLLGSAHIAMPAVAVDREWRVAALALFLLEELLWALEDAMTIPRMALAQSIEPIVRAASRVWWNS